MQHQFSYDLYCKPNLNFLVTCLTNATSVFLWSVFQTQHQVSCDLFNKCNISFLMICILNPTSADLNLKFQTSCLMICSRHTCFIWMSGVSSIVPLLTVKFLAVQTYYNSCEELHFTWKSLCYCKAGTTNPCWSAYCLCVGRGELTCHLTRNANFRLTFCCFRSNDSIQRHWQEENPWIPHIWGASYFQGGFHCLWQKPWRNNYYKGFSFNT